MEILAATDAISWRGIERLMISGGAIIFAFLGYRLYALGITPGRSKVNVDSRLIAFAVSGTGPGLIFMAFGALVLVFSIMKGGASQTVTEETIKQIEDDVTETVVRILTSEVNIIQSRVSNEFESEIEDFRRHVAWFEEMMQDVQRSRYRIRTGVATPGELWKRTSDDSLTVQIDTSEGRFRSTPIYFWTLEGTDGYPHLPSGFIGEPSPTGFLIRIYFGPGNSPSLEQISPRWRVRWVGVEEG